MIKPTKEFLEVFKSTNGALSVTESIAIMNLTAQLNPRIYLDLDVNISYPLKSLWLELGTHEGKSSMSALYGNKHVDEFLLVDPEFNKSINIKTIADTFNKVIKKQMKFVFVEDYSTVVLSTTNYKFSYCFVDSGSHQDGLPMQEVKLLEDRMVQGGIIAFHDFRSQFVEVEEAYNYLLGTGKYEEIIIDWREITDYVDENNLEEGNQSWHHTELKNPCFVGAVKRK